MNMNNAFRETNGWNLQTSAFAVEEDGTEPKEIRRSWRERIFGRPWRPWVSTKTIQVTHYKPAIFRVGNTLIYHPALQEELLKAIEEYNIKRKLA